MFIPCVIDILWYCYFVVDTLFISVGLLNVTRCRSVNIRGRNVMGLVILKACKNSKIESVRHLFDQCSHLSDIPTKYSPFRRLKKLVFMMYQG